MSNRVACKKARVACDELPNRLPREIWTKVCSHGQDVRRIRSECKLCWMDSLHTNLVGHSIFSWRGGGYIALY